MTTRIFLKEEQMANRKKNYLKVKKMGYFKCVENYYFHKSRKSNQCKHAY